MLDEGVREEVKVSPVGLQARPGALVRLVEEISNLRTRADGCGLGEAQDLSSLNVIVIDFSAPVITDSVSSLRFTRLRGGGTGQSSGETWFSVFMTYCCTG